MKRTQFSWVNFPEAFVRNVLQSEKAKKRGANYCEDEDIYLMSPEMDKICTSPNNQFVKDYRREIEDYFLAGSNSLLRICKNFEKRNYGGIKVGSNEEMLKSLKEKKLTASIREAYLNELNAYGRKYVPENDSSFETEKIIDLRNSHFGDIQMEDFQRDAVAALDSYFNIEDKKSGILMLPTGGGKTRVATVFLIKYMLSKGYQIIWLAHRHMLIDQAADNLYKIAPLAAQENDEKNEVHLLCISSRHSNIRAFRPYDDIVVGSVQSLCINKDYLPNNLQKKVMILIDEAHHAVAPSYKSIIDTIRKERPDAKLLGLTATPVRGNDEDTKRLKKLFDNKIIYSTGVSDLIAKGFLATPVYKKVSTNEDIESYTTKDEHKYIKRWGEMPSELLRKVAESNARNEVIVEQYVKNKEKYGKTLVFALNGYHCIVLNEMFQRAGINSDYIYTLNGDNDNYDKIKRFKEGKLDVLININILTEGSDVPDIQTVFLTRPTSSETLLMQMVGRGMRGLGCGGTETVNIVDFCDKWNTITKWMSPEHILNEYRIVEKVPEEPIQTSEYTYEPASLIPAEMIRDLADTIVYLGGRSISFGHALPAGWFSIFDTNGNDRKVLVFESQIKPYERMRIMQDRIGNDKDIDAEWVFEKCFSGLETAPSKEDLGDIINYIRKAEVFPEMNTFEERKEVEPHYVAKRLKEEHITLDRLPGKLKEIYEQHKKTIDSIYMDYSGYMQKVLLWIGNDSGQIPVGSIIEEVEDEFKNKSDKPFAEELTVLLNEVISEMRSQLPEDFVAPSIKWTDREYSKIFADYNSEYNAIRVNSVLNFENVPREVLKYLIYHECLHQENMSHDKAFREKEHNYPDFQNCDNWLDYQYPMYVKD